MANMCVTMVIIHTKTLEKKAVDDVTSTESLQLVRQLETCIIYSLINSDELGMISHTLLQFQVDF